MFFDIIKQPVKNASFLPKVSTNVGGVSWVLSFRT